MLFVLRYEFQGYLHALGMKRTAEVKRDARIGEAEAQRDAGIKVKFLCFSGTLQPIVTVLIHCLLLVYVVYLNCYY